MGRNTKETLDATPDPKLNETALAAMGAAPAQLAAIREGYTEDRDLLNQLLGQAQMADSFAKFSQTVWSSKLAFVKENKLYQQLAGKQMPNGLALKGTWGEFCDLLGVSDEKANQDIANLKAFGEEALESMSRMGIGYRELRQYRKLPEDQKQALIEVAKAGDKEGFVELAEEIIAKHAKEKEALKIELDDARDQADDLATSKKALEDSLAEARKQARQFAKASPDEQAQTLRTSVEDVAKVIEADIDTTLDKSLKQLLEHGDETGASQKAWVQGQLQTILDRVKKVADRMNIELSLKQDDKPAWMQGVDVGTTEAAD